MTISSAELADLIREIELEDPIDYADLPYAEDDLRRLVCSQIRSICNWTGVRRSRRSVLTPSSASRPDPNAVPPNQHVIQCSATPTSSSRAR